MRPRKELYQVICTKLAALITNGTLKYVDLNKGQLDNPAQGYPISFPAVLISIDRGLYSHKVENRVDGDVEVSLVVAYDDYHDTFIGAIGKAASEALLDRLDTIIETLTYTRGDNFTDLHLASETFLPYTFKGLHAHRITFTTKTIHKLKNNAKLLITSGA